MSYKKVVKRYLRAIKNLLKKILTKAKCLIKNLLNTFNYFLKLLLKSRKKNTFSIVTATYNSGKYLDKYFKSILSNSYENKNIEIIIVDDGSTDNTKGTIKKWQKESNITITYVYQENQGQAVARNKGLNYAKNEWVTFIDSDDFINIDYFKEVNNAINITKSKSIISTNWINYYENIDEYEDDHPLNYRFLGSNKVKIKNMLKDYNFFQLSMNSVFFKRDIIESYNIKTQDIKPQFEDAIFVMDYVRKSNNYNIAFVKNSKYYYRKRSDGSSTLNKAHTDTKRYVELLMIAYIKVLKDYKEECGNIPKFVQNAVIYDLSWNIKELESNKINLSNEQRKLREEHLTTIFSYIDFDNIVNNWKYLWKMYQIGINYKYYSGQEEIKQGVYVHYQTDTYYKYLLIDVEDKWEIYLNNKLYKLNDIETKKYVEKINGKFFVNKRFIKISKHFDDILIKYDGLRMVLPKEHKKETTFNKDSLIIFYDRKNKADDNAEVMYDWMMQNHPEYKNCYFAIEENSIDYKRLQKKEFKLINYGTEEFEKMYIDADYILSSGLDRSIENYKNLRYNTRSSKKSEAKFIFLQHGIITDDLSEWFSTKRVDKVVTSVNIEYNNLISKYNLFEEEVILTGLPRYDKLYNNPENEILVQFTWRMQYKDYNLEQIKETDYFKNIVNLLTDQNLQKTLKENNYIIKFIPHPETNKFIDYFKKYENELIKVHSTNEISFRDEFATAKLMITDYSSVFADFAYLNKPIIYYQYDNEKFYRHHLYRSEMDYENDGLGSVQKTYENLVDKIAYYVGNDCELEETYEKKINAFFKYNDQNNCQRLYSELCTNSLEVDIKNNFMHLEVLKGKEQEKIVGNIFLMVNDKRIYTINVDSIKEKVPYYNIIIPQNILQEETYKLNIINETNGKYEVLFSNERKITVEQQDFNEKYGVKKEKFYNKEQEYDLYISKRGNTKNPEKILISFGSYGHFDAEVRYPVSYFGSLNNYLDKTMIIAFQDQYFVDGTYFLVDDKGRELREVLISYIKNLLNKYNLPEEGLIFYGASKGATVSIDIASNFKGTKVFLNAPQINLYKFLKSRIHHYGLVYQYLKIHKKDDYDVSDKLNFLVEFNEVCYAFSSKDPMSNCGIIEILEHRNLIKKDYLLPHRMVAHTAWEWQEKEIIKKIKK